MGGWGLGPDGIDATDGGNASARNVSGAMAT